MKAAKDKEPDTHPDAWQRFERAIDVVAKSPPQHKSAKGKNEPKPTAVPKQRGASSKP
jgi:hypothetical protein